MSAVEVSRMAERIADAGRDQKLEFREADALVREALTGTLTRERLELAEALFESPPAQVEAFGQVTADAGGQALAQTLYWGMPRDVSGHERSGQSFTEGLSQTATQYFLGDRPRFPLTLEVKGSAREAYALSFSIAEARLTVSVPRGATPQRTAALVAEAINRRSEEISASSLAPGAMRFKDSDAYCNGVKAAASGATVKLAPDIDA